MRKTALLILLVGFIFVSFSVPFMGIDLLLDPVGWLLVWNALRALRLKDRVIGASVPVALVLVPVSALQLFLATGTLSLVLALLQAGLEAALFLLMLRGFDALLTQQGAKGDRLFAGIVLGLNVTSALVPLCPLFFTGPSVVMAANLWLVAVRLLLLGLLLRLVFVLDETKA